jgi:hypothetical protein
MHRAALTRRGPSPWRRGQGGAELHIEPLVAVASLQLAVVLAWSACLALLTSVAYGDWSAISCFDGDEPACTDPSPFPLERFLFQSAAWAAVIAVAAAAVLVAWRRARAAPVALALPPLAALLANRLAEIPLPL